MLKTIKLYQKISLASILSLIAFFVFSTASANAFFTSCGNLICPTDRDDTEITDFTVDFDPTDNETTVDVLVDDAEADVSIYYSTTQEINAVLDVVENGDDGSIDLYIGVCSTTDCTPHDPVRMVVKVQQEGSDTVLVQRIEIDDDGNESIFSSYEDTTTDLSDEELAWLMEVIQDDSSDDSTDNTGDETTDNSGSDDSGSSSDSSGDSSNSSSSSNTEPASPPVCSAETPSALSGLRITNQGTNSVALSWNAANPVTHYAIIFTRNSDGEQYGASNIGNTTNYTIEGISGQASYTFEVFAVNNCKPGDRDSVTSSTFTGPVLEARPTGTTGTSSQVLGATTDTELENTIAETVRKATPRPSPSSTIAPAVLGATDTAILACGEAFYWLPIFILILQAVVIAGIEYYYRGDKTKLRWYLVIIVSIVSMLTFYGLSKCKCTGTSLNDILCYWYWLIASLIGIGGRFAGMQFAPVKKNSKKK